MVHLYKKGIRFTKESYPSAEGKTMAETVKIQQIFFKIAAKVKNTKLKDKTDTIVPEINRYIPK